MADNTTPQSVLDAIEAQAPASMHPLLEKAFKHQKQIILGVSAILVITLIYAGINWYNQRAMTSAQDRLGSILIEKAGQDKIDALELLLAQAPSSVRPAVLLELAQTCTAQTKYEKAVQYWGDLAGATDGDLSYVARLGKAKALVESGKPAEAVTELKTLSGVNTEAFTIPTYRQLGQAAELAGQKDEALAAYRKLIELNVGDKPFVEYKISLLEN